MKSINLDRALLEIADLLNLAFAGEEIIITNDNQEQIKITPVSAKLQRPPLFGSDKDVISMSDDFDEPLEDFQEYM